MSETQVLHIAYGDELAQSLHEHDPAAATVVVRDALRDGPLPPIEGDRATFVTARADHLVERHDADPATARADLAAAWDRVAGHGGPLVLHVDEIPCVDCATFVACALEVLQLTGRGGDPVEDANEPTGVTIVHGVEVDPDAEQLMGGQLAAGAGVWRLLQAGDEPALTMAATDLEGTGGIPGMPELAGLLLHRVRGDVALDDIHP